MSSEKGKPLHAVCRALRPLLRLPSLSGLQPHVSGPSSTWLSFWGTKRLSRSFRHMPIPTKMQRISLLPPQALVLPQPLLTCHTCNSPGHPFGLPRKLHLQDYTSVSAKHLRLSLSRTNDTKHTLTASVISSVCINPHLMIRKFQAGKTSVRYHRIYATSPAPARLKVGAQLFCGMTE